jgi:hypothetical protein
MKAGVRLLIFRRFENLHPRLPWAGCSAALLFGTPIYGQTTLPVPGRPPAAQPTAPAEIQPGHPAIGNAPPAQREGKDTGVIRPPSVGVAVLRLHDADRSATGIS